MSIQDWIKGGCGILFLITALIQVAPIKINPWSKIARAVGKALNSEVLDKIDESNASTCRYRILRFDDEIRHKVKHSEEHFNQIISDIDKYEKYCKKHPAYENSKAVSAIRNIRDAWEKCKKENSFLV